MKTRHSITGLILVYITTMIYGCSNPSDNSNKLIVKKWKLESFKVVDPDSASAPKPKRRTLKDTSDNLAAVIDSINRAPSIPIDTNLKKKLLKEITMEFKADGRFKYNYAEGPDIVRKGDSGTWELLGNAANIVLKGNDNSIPPDTLSIIELSANKLSIEYIERTLKSKRKELVTYVPFQ